MIVSNGEEIQSVQFTRYAFGLKRADVHERSGVKRGFARWPACGLRRRERVPLRSVRGALFFCGTFLLCKQKKSTKLGERNAAFVS